MGFYDFVRTHASPIMVCSRVTFRYGRIHNVHASENPFLLKDILRKEWGFDGIVMSDWYVLSMSPIAE